MIPVSTILKEFQLMYKEDWEYVSGGSSHKKVDCQGAFKYVFRKYGESSGWSGSNDMARNYVVTLIPMSRAKLVPGMVVFRSKEPGESGYKLPGDYKRGGRKYNGDLRDYYHIGLVDEDTNYYLHASGTKEDFNRTKTNVCEYAAYLRGIDYGNISTSTTTSQSSSVFTHYPLRSNQATVTSSYGTRNGSPHRGIDLGVPGNPDGTIPVQAVLHGKVTRANYSDSYGYVVYLEHSAVLETRYAHLHSLSVSVGEEVTAGTQLGYMGTTGDSSAPHLHFEVLVNGDQVDPAPYLPVVNNSSTSSSGTGSNYELSGDTVNDASNVPYTPTAIVGRRVSQIVNQPIHAYIKISIGDKILSSNPPRPNTIQRLTVNRLDSVGTTAEFTIFDDNWDEIEDIFRKHWDNVIIEYGYSNPNIPPKSFIFQLSDYSLDFNSEGTLMNISALSTGAYKNLNPVTVEGVHTYNPTEAVEQICQYMGWQIGVMEETVDVVMDNPFTLVNDHPVTYILELIKLAQTQNGEMVEFDLDDSVNPPIANLKRFTYENDNPESIKTYIYQKGYDSPVQSLTFNINGVFGGAGPINTASGLRSGVIDTKSKEISYYRETNKTVIISSTGEYQDIKENQSIPYVDYGGYSGDQAHKKLSYSLHYAFTNHYTATMVILGDTTIEIMDDVRIINLTDEGNLHHTSGIYKVIKILDSISDGNFLTTLELNRIGSINEGVELINPKVIVK